MQKLLNKFHRINRKNKSTDINSENNRILFRRLIGLQRRILIEVESSIWTPESVIRFALIEDIVLAVAKYTKSKINFGVERYNKSPRYKEESHTDEQLVASAFYSSLIDHKPITIVTCDSDIHRLSKYTQFVMMQSQKFPAEYGRSLGNNKLLTYLIYNRNIGRRFDSEDMMDGLIYLDSERIKECENPELKAIVDEKLEVLARIDNLTQQKYEANSAERTALQ